MYTECASLRSSFVDEKTIQAVEAQLRADCGAPCTQKLHEMLGWLEANAEAVSAGQPRFDGGSKPAWKTLSSDKTATAGALLEALHEREAEGAEQRADVLLSRTSEESRAVVPPSSQKDIQPSFLSGSRGVTDTPCSSSSTCSALEKMGNVCNYGRVGAATAYQAANIGVHVLEVLASGLCGCLHVYSFSTCILSVVTPICSLPSRFVVGKPGSSMSKSLWNTVRGTSTSCIMHGHPLVSLTR
jgi:hypothetical protein